MFPKINKELLDLFVMEKVEFPDVTIHYDLTIHYNMIIGNRKIYSNGRPPI